jgi:hypothetical protein
VVGFLLARAVQAGEAPATDRLQRWLPDTRGSPRAPGRRTPAPDDRRLDDGSPLNYGWGVGLIETPNGRRVSHAGGWDPWLAKSVRVPQ